MNWTEISITANHDTIPIISNILEEFGSNGVVIEDSLDLQNGFADKFGEIYELNPDDYPVNGVRVKAYFNEMKYTQDFKKDLIHEIKSIESLDTNIFEYQQQTIQEHDWENEWKNYFHPFRAS